jgi:hypothetical protein
VVGTVGLLVAVALAVTVTVTVGTGAAASRSRGGCAGPNGPPAVTGGAGQALTVPADGAVAVPAGGPLAIAGKAVAARAGGKPVEVLAPQPGAVIVAGTAARAHRLRLTARVSIARRVRGLGLRLNGHPIRLPARRGRLRVVLDAADGLIVGKNLLWVTVRGRDGNPTVRFVVGYRYARALGIHLRLGAGTLPAAAATLRVPKTGIDHLSVTLNGVPRRVPPDGGPNGRLVLDLPELGPVHWGANRVRVRLIMMDGRIADWARTFHLDRRRDVAVARLDGTAVVGRAVVLDASRSLIVRGVSQARGVRWVLLRRPAFSRARLGKPKGARIALRPDVPGYYVVGLAVGCGPRRGYAVATVAASYDEPLVPLDTIHYAQAPPPPPGVWGVQVGGDFYAEKGYPVQVVVLDRATLGLVNNTGFQASAQGFDAMQGYFQSLPNSDLVIVTHTGTESAAALPSDSLPALDSALHAIGGSLAARWTLSTPHCWSGGTDQCGHYGSNPSQVVKPTWQRGDYDGGSFSAIGVPGLAVGQAWRETAVQTGAQNGAISGYFTRGTDQGSASDYTVINGGADQYEAVDTCAPPNCDVQIGYPGDPHYRTYPAPGPNGLQVLELDRTRLAPIVNRTVTTEGDLLDALTAAGGQQGVGHVVGSIDDQRLVIIRSVGDGRLSGLGGGGPTSQAPLLQYIDELGGTPDLLWDVMSGHYKYALVGAATNLPWRNPSALESSTGIPGTPQPNPSTPGGVGKQTGRISGVLKRDPTGLYTPLAADPIGTSNSELYHILYQPATAWPYADDTQDLKSIADQLGLTGYPDVRSAYYKNINEPWASLQLTLENPNKVKCPYPQADCDTFEKVRAELDAEFTWVQEVQSFASRLLEPYEGEYSNAIEQVYDDVKQGVPGVPDSAKVDMGWLKIFTDVMHIASGLATVAGQPELAAAFGLLAGAGTLATDVMETQKQDNGAPASADTLSGTKDELSTQLADQVTTYKTWVGQMEGILLRDYMKLKAVGAAVLGDPAWAWGTDTTADTAIALKGNMRAAAYSALLPKVWPAYNLKPDLIFPTPTSCTQMMSRPSPVTTPATRMASTNTHSTRRPRPTNSGGHHRRQRPGPSSKASRPSSQMARRSTRPGCSPSWTPATGPGAAEGIARRRCRPATRPTTSTGRAPRTRTPVPTNSRQSGGVTPTILPVTHCVSTVRGITTGGPPSTRLRIFPCRHRETARAPALDCVPIGRARGRGSRSASSLAFGF